MANKKKRRPQKPQKPKRTKKYQAPVEDEDYGSGGGVMQGMVRGMQKAAGVHETQKKKRGSLLGNIFWYALLAGAVGYLIYNLVS